MVLNSEPPYPQPPLALRAALWATATAVLGGWLLLAVIHLSDGYRTGHLQGVWIAVAEAARHGRLYPPIFDGSHYSGTRYMPLPILLNATAAMALGDAAVAGKALAALLMAVVLMLTCVLLRRRGCPWPLAVGCAAVIVATDVGLQAGTSIGGDVLPVALQLGAIAAIGRTPQRTVAAGMFAGLAAASKLTALWGVLSIATVLLAEHDRRRLLQFAGTAAATLLLVVGAVAFLTHGRLLEHLGMFAFAGVASARSVVRAPNQMLFNLVSSAFGAVVLLPFAAVGPLLRPELASRSIVHVAIACALLLLLIVYSDIGTGPNQLLDLVVLVVLAAGSLPGLVDGANGSDMRRVATMVAAVAVVWALSLDLVRTVGFDLRHTWSSRGVTAWKDELRDAVGTLGAGDEVLTEDPSVAILLGREPVVMDPFMLARIGAVHPEWVDPLVARIDARTFTAVVLVVSLDDPSVEYWWTDYHFGRRIAQALRRSYKFDRLAGWYFVYRPRAAASAPASAAAQ